jgi:glycosyltransferase involved in cell wall biosynthesis
VDREEGPEADVSALPEVLVDATILRAGSGLYGIGRVTYDLLRGLSDLRDEWRGRMRISALSSLEVSGRATISEDLAAVADEAIGARGTASSWLDAARRAWLGPVARRRGVALVHMPEMRGTPLVLPVARVSTCHDLISLRDPRHYVGVCVRYPDRHVAWRAGFVLGLAKEWHRYRNASRVVAISRSTRDDLVRFLRFDPARIDVVPNGVDVTRWQASGPDASGAGASQDAAILAKHGLGARPFLLYVGACDYRKNVPTMLRALAKARESEDLELVWAAGLPDWKLRAVERQIAEAGVGAHVKMLGFVADEELPALYRAARAHLFLSRIEGFGLTVVEAMLAGCPVIAARGSGCDEMLEDAGVIVDADDADGAAAGALRLRDPAFRGPLVERGRTYGPRYSREAMARGYAESYAKALDALTPRA